MQFSTTCSTLLRTLDDRLHDAGHIGRWEWCPISGFLMCCDFHGLCLGLGQAGVLRVNRCTQQVFGIWFRHFFRQSQHNLTFSPFFTTWRLDLYLSRRILAVAGFLLVLPPAIVTLYLDQSWSNTLMASGMRHSIWVDKIIRRGRSKALYSRDQSLDKTFGRASEWTTSFIEHHMPYAPLPPHEELQPSPWLQQGATASDEPSATWQRIGNTVFGMILREDLWEGKLGLPCSVICDG